MAEERETLGYLACPWCRDLWGHDGLLTVGLNRKGKVYAVCEGGPDGKQPSCGQGNNLHARHSARLKAMLAEAARRTTPATNPEPEPMETEIDRPTDPDPAEVDQQPSPEPVAETEPANDGGSDISFFPTG